MLIRICVIFLLSLYLINLAWSHFSKPAVSTQWGQADPAQMIVDHASNRLLPQQKTELATVDKKVANAAAAKIKQCFQTGPYNADQVKSLTSILNKNLPNGSWQSKEISPENEYWLIYSGGMVSRHEADRAVSRLTKKHVQTLGVMRLGTQFVVGLQKVYSAQAAEKAVHYFRSKHFEWVNSHHTPATTTQWLLAFTVDQQDILKLQSIQYRLDNKLLESCY